MKSINFRLFILALALCVGMLSGCGGGKGSDVNNTPPPTTYTVTLNLVGTTGTLSATSVTANGTVSVTGVGVVSGYQTPITATNCTLSGTTCTSGAINANTTITLTATAIPVTPGIDNVKKSLRAVYDTDLLSTPICFQVQTHGTGFHVVVTRTDSGGESAILKDDGDINNDCDVTSGDGIFSGKLTMTSVPSLPAHGGKIGRLMFSVSLVDNTTSATLMGLPTQLRVVNVSLKGTVGTTTYGAFTIASNALLYKVPFANSREDVAKAVYGIVKDTYDSLAISESRDSNNNGGAQDYIPVRQPAVYGTGITSFYDNSFSYGSNGVLLGVIFNSDADAWWQSFNHEGGIHMPGCCFATNSILPFSNDGMHLTALFDFPDGQMGGAAQYIVEQSNGDYVATDNTTTAGKLSQLTKYFDRVITVDKLPATMCLASKDTGYMGNPMPGTVIPRAQVKCFTRQDVVAQFGTVSPARATPIVFHVLPVVRYEDGQLNDALITSKNWISAFYAGTTACGSDTTVPPLPCSFSGAMDGDASLSTTVSLK